MKELKALEILKAILEQPKEYDTTGFKKSYIHEAIAELEAPKTCDGCIHDRKEPIGEYNFCDCCSRANRDKYEPKESL